MKRYGLVLADNGSPWYFQGTADTRWPEALLDELKDIPASAFEAVDTSSLMISPNSMQSSRTRVIADVQTPLVIAGLDQRSIDSSERYFRVGWMPGSSPGMTAVEFASRLPDERPLGSTERKAFQPAQHRSVDSDFCLTGQLRPASLNSGRAYIQD